MHKYYILIAFFFPVVFKAQQQWQPSEGPAGGYVSSLSASDNRVFAGTHAGIFVTTNGGASWNDANNNLPQTLYARSVATHDSNVVMTSEYGTYFSLNNGLSWQTSTPKLSFIKVKSIGNSYFGCAFNGVYKSADHGATWFNCSTGIPEQVPYDYNDIYDIHLFANKLFAAASGGIFVSDTSGTNWSMISNAVLPTCFDHISDTLYAGTASGVFFSADTGKHWFSAWVGVTKRIISCIQTKASQLTVGTDSGIFVSNNSGASWQTRNQGLGVLPLQSLVLFGDTLFASTGVSVSHAAGYAPPEVRGGIYRSDNNGVTWTTVSNFVPDLSTSSLTKVGSLLIAGSVNGVYLSANSGQSWVTRNNGLSNLQVNCVFFDGQTLYAGTCNGVYTSQDTGAHWINSSTGLSLIPEMEIRHFAQQGSFVLAGTSYGIFASNNSGVSWLRIDNNFTGHYPTISLTVLGNYIFQGVNDGMYLYNYNGMSWTFERNLFSYLTWPYALATHNGNVFARLDGHIYMTADTGRTWVQKDTAYTGAYTLLSQGGILYAGTDNGVHYTVDNGDNWQPLGTGISQMEVYSLCGNFQELYAATNGGVWHHSVGAVSGTTVYKHEQIMLYPNPARELLTIRSSFRGSEVSISNALGEVVMLIHPDLQETINISSLQRGLYFVRIGSTIRKFVKD